MKTIAIKDLVQQAVKDAWPALRERHPHLAEVLEESAVVDAAVQSLADDPAYQQAMSEAAAAGVVAEVAGDLVRRFVQAFLRRL